MFLQETYCSKQFKTKFNREWLHHTEKIKHSYTQSNHSRGVAILFKKGLNIKISNTNKDTEGRKLIINCTVNDYKLSLVNIYSPNVLVDRVSFFQNSSKWVKQNITEDTSIFMGGDFNSVYESKDRTSGKVEKCSVDFKNLMVENKLIDVYRTHNKEIGFTWINPSDPSHRSRLDYLLTTNYLNQYIKSCRVITAPTPDHKAVVAKVELVHKQRGNGYWKLNTSILSEENYKIGVIDIIKKTIDEYDNIVDKRVLWDFCKIRIKEYSIKYCVNRSKNRKNELKNLQSHFDQIEKELENESSNIEFLKTEREEVKNKIDAYMLEKARGTQIRSRAKWVEEGEKNTAFFARLENRHQTNNTITKLEGNIENDSDILNEIMKFYKKLYTSSNPDIENIKTYLHQTKMNNILSEDDKNICEGLISKDECSSVIKHMKNNKSPGLDGLPIEFYKAFWSEIGDLLVQVYNESFIEKELSVSQRTSVLTLLFKKGDRLLLKNYRPISLATSDYKILAFVLANRLQKVLNKIIASSQAGYIKNRFIGCNIRLIEDLIDYCENLNEEASIIFLDFEKAFDSVEWAFIFETLKSFNFGDQFIQWVQTLYSNAGAKVKNNGYLSETFTINRGVRQGCPLSALLFVLVVEIMALNIKQDDTIKGIKIKANGKVIEKKLTQLADDMQLFLNDFISLQNAFKNIKQFSKVAGPQLNLDKCEGIPLNKNPEDMSNHWGLKWVNIAKCLGIYVGLDKVKCQKYNWNDKILLIEQLLSSWGKRELTIFGKIVVIKMLALSKITYSVTNTIEPKDAASKLNKMFFNFLWGGNDKIKRNIMINDYEQGGLKMIDVSSYFKAIKASWIDRYKKADLGDWAVLMQIHLDSFGTNMLINMTFDQISLFQHLKEIPEFYQSVILSFNESKMTKPPLTSESLMNSMIWGNKYLTYGKKTKQTLYFKSWIDVQIIYMKDILIHNGKIDQNYIFDRLNQKVNFLSQMSMLCESLKPYKNVMVSNIPNSVVFTLTKEPIFNIDNKNIKFDSKPSKFFYNQFIKEKCELVSLNAWNDEFDSNEIALQSISKIMLYKIIQIKENKIKEFNYKLLFRKGACGRLVNKWDSNVSNVCSTCNTPETQLHIIYKCPLVRNIWKHISKTIGITITASHIVFGSSQSNVINNLISQIAYSIHKYWVIVTNNRSIVSEQELLRLVKSDLLFKSRLMTQVGETAIADLYEKVAPFLLPNR